MTDYTVSSVAELQSTLSKARGGDSISLKSGDFGNINLNGFRPSGNVTIKAASGADVDGLSLTNCANLTFQGIHFDGPSNSGQAVVQVANSDDITIANCEVNGKVDTVYPITGPTYGIHSSNGSTGITLLNNYVHDVANGIAASGTRDLHYKGNVVDRVGSDGFKFSGVDGALIENNTGPTHFYPQAAAHEDFMQFQGAASSNVVIRGNVFVPQNIMDVQGIFVAGNGGHTNILIENNLVYTGMPNGILVENGKNVKIYNNTVLNAVNDKEGVTYIAAPGADVRNNITSSKTGGMDGSNLVVQHLDPKADYYYGDMFSKGLLDGSTVTLSDIKPLAGSLAAKLGAYPAGGAVIGVTDPAVSIAKPTPSSSSSGSSGGTTTTDGTSSSGGKTPSTALDSHADAVYKLAGDHEFSGSNAVLVADNPRFNLGEGSIAFSFEADNVSQKGMLVAKDAGGYDNHFASWVKGGKLFVRFEDDDSGVLLRARNIQANKEYDVVATFEDDRVALYVDDKLVASKHLTMDWSDNDTNLGIGHNFDGTISDVLILDTAESPQSYDYFS